jgi:hypothetical protein
MINFRSRIKLITLFSVIFFATSLCGFKGLVFCYGSDGHIHTEITFNGVDCGHFPCASPDQVAPTSLVNSYSTFHTNHCISCVDIPLSLDYSIKKFDNSFTKRTLSKLRNIPPQVPSSYFDFPFSSSRFLSVTSFRHLSPSLNLIQKTILLL